EQFPGGEPFHGVQSGRDAANLPVGAGTPPGLGVRQAESNSLGLGLGGLTRIGADQVRSRIRSRSIREVRVDPRQKLLVRIPGELDQTLRVVSRPSSRW